MDEKLETTVCSICDILYHDHPDERPSPVTWFEKPDGSGEVAIFLKHIVAIQRESETALRIDTVNGSHYYVKSNR